jgi:hypothetical protein
MNHCKQYKTAAINPFSTVRFFILYHVDPLLAMTAKQTTIQQQLPSNGSANKHVSATSREQQ